MIMIMTMKTDLRVLVLVMFDSIVDLHCMAKKPATMTYDSVVLYDIVHLVLMIVALNHLDVTCGDVLNRTLCKLIHSCARGRDHLRYGVSYMRPNTLRHMIA